MKDAVLAPPSAAAMTAGKTAPEAMTTTAPEDEDEPKVERDAGGTLGDGQGP